MEQDIGIFSIWECRTGFFIGYKEYMCDDEIIEATKIPYDDYIKILKSYKAKFNVGEYFFNKRSDAIKCAEFLNEKYGLIIKLLEI